MADNIKRALVTAPTFINSVLHLPGEVAYANLDELGVDALDKETKLELESAVDGRKISVTANLTPGLTEVGKNEGETVIETPIAAVAPHAPGAPNPQGLPPGTVQSGTGRLVQLETSGLGPMRAAPIVPAKPEEAPVAVQPVGADAPITDEERAAAAAETKQQGKTQKPSK